MDWQQVPLPVLVQRLTGVAVLLDGVSARSQAQSEMDASFVQAIF